jgi:hypothetical protein
VVTDTPDSCSMELAYAGPENGVHTIAGSLGSSSTTGSGWSLNSLRTDSVNRGFCISLVTLAIVVLSRSIKFLFFFIPRP